MDTSTVNESRDGTGAGDHNIDFAWGTPASYLTTIQRARLLILRGYVLDTKRGERGGAADGDLAYTDSESYTDGSEPQIPVEAPAQVSEPEPMPNEGFYDG